MIGIMRILTALMLLGIVKGLFFDDDMEMSNSSPNPTGPNCYCMFTLMNWNHKLEGYYNSTIYHDLKSCSYYSSKYCKKICKSRAYYIVKSSEWYRKLPHHEDMTVGDYICKKEKMDISGLYGGVFYKTCDSGSWHYTYRRTKYRLYCKNGQMLTES